MEVRSPTPEGDVFGPVRDGEPTLDSTYPYLSVIGALMYLANSTRPDISFTVDLARSSQAPTRRHWSGVKRVLRYLKGTEDYGLFYARQNSSDGRDQTDPSDCHPVNEHICNLIGYTDAGYLSDPHSAKSQTGCLFLSHRAAISWKSTKQPTVATSSI